MNEINTTYRSPKKLSSIPIIITLIIVVIFGYTSIYFFFLKENIEGEIAIDKSKSTTLTSPDHMAMKEGYVEETANKIISQIERDFKDEVPGKDEYSIAILPAGIPTPEVREYIRKKYQEVGWSEVKFTRAELLYIKLKK